MNAKVQAVGAAGAATLVLVWAASLAGVQVPPEIASAVTVLFSTAAGWLRPETKAKAPGDVRGLTLVEVLVVLLIVLVVLMLVGALR